MGFVVIGPVILVKVTFHFLSVVLCARLNLETGETPAWNMHKSEVWASDGQGRRAA